MPKTRLVTAEELFRDGPRRAELIRGEVVPLMPTGGEHARTVARVTVLLAGGGAIASRFELFAGDAGFVIERDPDTVRAPDVAIVRRSRLEGLDLRKFLPFAPDLAVEVVSPGDAPHEVAAKARMWIEHGTGEVWVVDPGTERVTVHRPGGPPTDLAGNDILTGRDLFPSFSVPVRKLFC